MSRWEGGEPGRNPRPGHRRGQHDYPGGEGEAKQILAGVQTELWRVDRGRLLAVLRLARGDLALLQR